MAGKLTEALRRRRLIDRALRESLAYIKEVRKAFIEGETLGPLHDMATMPEDALPILDEFDKLIALITSGRSALAEGKSAGG